MEFLSSRIKVDFSISPVSAGEYMFGCWRGGVRRQRSQMREEANNSGSQTMKKEKFFTLLKGITFSFELCDL